MIRKRARVRFEMVGVLALCGAATQVHATCTFGGSGEPSLQTSFNGWLGAGAVNTQTGCIADGNDSQWATSTGGATILLELAGNANTNTFGIYDLSNPANRLTIFAGGDSAGTDAIIRLTSMGNGDWRVTVAGNLPTANITVHQASFGFYLGTAAHGDFFSQTARNGDGLDHMYAYQGTNTQFLSGPLAGSIFQSNDYILAWEDLPASLSDRDYQDFVVDVLNVNPLPVPIPSALWLAASGLIGLFGIGRRKQMI
jgi:hypothetical protein